ncbi:DUF7310 family coiled-coil domain-containing protein [Halobellus sp. GM3]|uniref:DUF7310 family coiled-coil domain-containing protein n=1 Tax=Halobellus sp. GM3 TaxID=3458410 RepID=UPI00403DB80A
MRHAESRGRDSRLEPHARPSDEFEPDSSGSKVPADGDHPSDGDDAANACDPPAEDRLEALDRRLTALEADLESVRGLLDGVGAVDEAVERRASIALAKVETLERAVDAEDRGLVRERLPEARDATDGHPTAADSTYGSTADSTYGSPRGSSGPVTEGRPEPDHGESPPLDGGAEAGPGETLASRLRDAFR